MRIVGGPFLVIGIGLLIATLMGKILFNFADHDNRISSEREAYEYLVLIIQSVCGFAFFLIGVILLFIGNLCHQIVRRNNHISELEELIHRKMYEKRPY
jgi:hypothetical protein